MINPKLAAKHRKTHVLPSPTSGSSKSTSNAASAGSVNAPTLSAYPNEHGSSAVGDYPDWCPYDDMEVSDDEDPLANIQQLADSDVRATQAEKFSGSV